MKLRTVVIASLTMYSVFWRKDTGPEQKARDFYYKPGEPAKGRWMTFDRLVLLRHQELPNQPWEDPSKMPKPKEPKIPKGWIAMSDMGLVKAFRAANS